MSVFNANSVDPEQIPQYAASDLGVHCLPMSILWDARHRWVKVLIKIAADDIFIFFAEKTKRHFMPSRRFT